MTFSDHAWQQAAEIRAAVETMPFVTELGAGTLDREVFVGYLAQDTFYLDQYGKALALAATGAPSSAEAQFWVESARGALVVEQGLHGRHVHDLSRHTASPTTTAYTSYLLAQAVTGGYPVAAAALLPCFWLYADAGERLLALAQATDAGLAAHPYGDWIATYADPAFAESTARARQLVDEAADRAGEAVRARMLQAFLTACRYEWMFFDAAHRQETWPV